MDEQQVEQAVRRYYDLVDANDVEGVVAIFTPDAVYRRPGYEPFEGEDALRAFYSGDRVIESGKHSITDLVISGDRAAVAGTFNGVLKSGAATQLRFADFFTVTADGRFSARETFFFAPLV